MRLPNMLRTLFSWLLIRCRELLRQWILLGKAGLAVGLTEREEADGEDGLRLQAPEHPQARLALWHPTGPPLAVSPDNSPSDLTAGAGHGRASMYQTLQ